MNRTSSVVVVLLTFFVACSDSGSGVPKASGGAGKSGKSTSGTGGKSAKAAGGSGGSSSPGSGMTATGIPMDCRGFSFDGILYSPGGSVLPNTCEPFNPTLNNPYAVRCVDVWPWYKTQFPGDQFCILPPPPDKGVQYGVHPQGKQWFAQVSTGDMSGYDNVPDAFTMKDGEEEQFNYETGIDNPSPQNYYRNYARMRPGSHHMIVSTDDGTAPQEVWGPASTNGLFSGTSLPGAQRPDENAPKSLDKPAEDDGLYAKLPVNPGVIFNMHHFDALGVTILKEAWTNLWWEDNATIQMHGILGLDLGQTRSLAIPPGTTQDLHYSWDITQPIRLVEAFGHRHAWTANFSSWVERPDGSLDIIYQSFNWLDEPTYRYDSMTQNPPPAPDSLTDGATSGVRTLMPGEKLHFNCHIVYTDERAAAEKAPTPESIGTLHFANEAFTAEMCILFGSTAAVMLPTPTASTSTLPDFATVD
ncbi:MAG: hypothetical protein ACHQ53_14590 [Polyangiales bacterium]